VKIKGGKIMSEEKKKGFQFGPSLPPCYPAGSQDATFKKISVLQKKYHDEISALAKIITGNDDIIVRGIAADTDIENLIEKGLNRDEAARLSAALELGRRIYARHTI
jgi:hypothetical protein